MLLTAYLAGLIIYLVPYAWFILVAVPILLLLKKTCRYTTYGTARWATASDMPHMLEGHGLIVGHIEGKFSKIDGVRALFNSAIDARQACQRFLMAFQRKQPKSLVRLTTAVHTAVFAPSGAGKNVSIVEPFLLTSPESCIITDVKGENAEITALHRATVFGQKIMILDPWLEVTKSLRAATCST